MNKITLLFPGFKTKAFTMNFDDGIVKPAAQRTADWVLAFDDDMELKGDVFIPAKTDGRRWSDLEYGYIHPCSSFPASDLEVEVPAEYLNL